MGFGRPTQYEDKFCQMLVEHMSEGFSFESFGAECKAGKTTIMKVLATLLAPTQGSARILGHDVVTQRHPIRNVLGLLPQEFGAYGLLRSGEFVDYMARLSGVPRAERAARVTRVLEQVGLEKVRDRKVKKLSGGMLRRLGVAQAAKVSARRSARAGAPGS